MNSNRTKRNKLKLFGNILILALLKSNKFIYIYIYIYIGLYIKLLIIINITKF